MPNHKKMSKISKKFVWGILVWKNTNNFPKRTLKIIVHSVLWGNHFIIINAFNSRKLVVVFFLQKLVWKI